MILLLDADGVVLKKHRYFSERYAEERGLLLGDIQPFFKNVFVRCQKGEVDLKIELEPYLAKWKWEGTAEEFVTYWLTSDTEPDESVLQEVARLRAGGTQCYLASGQEKYRAAYITQLLGDKLDGFFYSCDLGVLKSDSQFFVSVLTKLGVPASDVVYFDNSETYLSAARAVGIDARLYTGRDLLTAL